MTTEKTEGKVTREKLIITQVKELMPVGDKGAKKLAFQAKNAEGKELSYFTFRQGLFGEIQVGKEIEVEIEVAQTESGGNLYTNRKVNQVYVEGKPVLVAGQGKSFSYGDKASIESQTAFKGVIELLVAKIITPDDVLGKAALSWAAERLGTKAEEKPPLVKHTFLKEPPKSGPDAQAEPATEPAPAEEDKGNALAPIKDANDFLKRFQKLDPKMLNTTLFGIAGVKAWRELATQPVDQLDELWIEVMARWGAEKAKPERK